MGFFCPKSPYELWRPMGFLEGPWAFFGFRAHIANGGPLRPMRAKSPKSPKSPWPSLRDDVLVLAFRQHVKNAYMYGPLFTLPTLVQLRAKCRPRSSPRSKNVLYVFLMKIFKFFSKNFFAYIDSSECVTHANAWRNTFVVYYSKKFGLYQRMKILVGGYDSQY